MGSVLDALGTDDAECCRMVANGKKVAGAIRSLVNARGLKLECGRVLLEESLVPVILYGSETMKRREK